MAGIKTGAELTRLCDTLFAVTSGFSYGANAEAQAAILRAAQAIIEHQSRVQEESGQPLGDMSRYAKASGALRALADKLVGAKA